MPKTKFNRPLIILAVLSGLAIIITIIIIAITTNTNSAKLEIYIAPTTATIEINNNSDYHNGTYTFKPGTYTATISMDGFNTKTIDLDLKENTTTKLYTFLEQSDGTYTYYLDHPSEAYIMDRIGDAEAKEEAAAYTEAHPLIKYLPIDHIKYPKDTDEYIEYHITGGKFTNCKSNFCVKIIDVTGNNYDNAIKDIKALGFNPEDLQILYEYTPITPLN